MKTHSLLWHLIRFRFWACVVALLTPLIMTAARLLFGLLLQVYFNALSGPTHDTLVPFVAVAVCMLMNVAASAYFYIGGKLTVDISFLITSLLQRNLFESFLERPGVQAISDSPGLVISNFRDDSQIIVSMLNSISNTIAQMLFALGAFIILFHINMFMTLVVFLPLVCVIAVVRSAEQRLIIYREASRKATGRVTEAIGEIFQTVQAIQVAGAEERVVKHFDRLNEQRRMFVIKDTVLSSGLNSIYGNAVGLGTGLILVLFALSLSAIPLRAGDLAIFIVYLGSVTTFVQGLGSFLAQYIQTHVSFMRLVSLMQGAPPQQLVAHKPLYLQGTEPPLVKALVRKAEHRLETLEAKGLTYHYSDTKRGIDEIDICLSRGSLTVITGRIGSGKTTCLRVLLGLLPKEEGEVRWNGQIVDDLASFFVPPHSAYTAQVPHLFSDTLKENILLGLPENTVNLLRVIHTTVMDHDVTNLERGINTTIGTSGVKLSGGQTQRTSAARMLVRDAELFVFDDLSSALDVETEQVLWDRLLIPGERTCLVVSHRREVLERATHIIVLKDGRVEARGDLKTLMEKSDEIRYLLNHRIETQE